MLQPVTFRLVVRNAVGVYQRTILRDATHILNKGFRLSLTPELICNEMTLTARNGPSPSNPLDLGLGLNPLDLVTVQFATTEMPLESDWLTVYYGELRQGGNPYDYLGEEQVLRGLDVRLRETPTLDKGYASMDGGALARQLTLDTLSSGLLGQVFVTALTYPPTPEGPYDTRVIRYDAAALPDLGFTMLLTATNGQPLGVLLDSIVATAKSAGIDVRWGVRPDGVLTMLPVSTLEIQWAAQQVEWKPPVCEVVYTAVNWSVGKRPDGTWLHYLSKGDAAALYGTRAKPLAVGTGLKVWHPNTLLDRHTGAMAASPAGRDPIDALRDGSDDSYVALSNAAGPVSLGIDLDVATDRLYIHTIQATTPPFIVITYPGGSTYLLRCNDVNNRAFTHATYYADAFPLGLPAGATVTLTTNPATAGGASSMSVTEFHGDNLDRDLLDGIANYHYQLPTSAPGDLYCSGLLPPSQFGGKIRTPRLNGQPDYTGNVALWEYTVSGDRGVQTAAKTGDPDTPEKSAANALIRKGDTLATANAVNVS